MKNGPRILEDVSFAYTEGTVVVAEVVTLTDVGVVMLTVDTLTDVGVVTLRDAGVVTLGAVTLSGAVVVALTSPERQQQPPIYKKIVGNTLSPA